MKIIAAALTTLSLALSSTALPTSGTTDAAAMTGAMTYFSPGLGACGKTNTGTDFIVAASAGLFDAQHPCGRRIRIKGTRGNVDVTVIDRCAGCQYYDLDLSPSAFEAAFGDLGIGRINANWDFI